VGFDTRTIRPPLRGGRMCARLPRVPLRFTRGYNLALLRGGMRVVVSNANDDGMTIDGIKGAELLAAYRRMNEPRA